MKLTAPLKQLVSQTKNFIIHFNNRILQHLNISINGFKTKYKCNNQKKTFKGYPMFLMPTKIHEFLKEKKIFPFLHVSLDCAF